MPEQLEFPYPLEEEALRTFLSQWLAIEDEYDRLRDMQRALADEYKPHLPLRAVRTAVKVVRARRKLEQHAKEPLAREYQTFLEDQVESHIRVHDLAHKLPDSGVHLSVPDMTETTG